MMRLAPLAWLLLALSACFTNGRADTETSTSGATGDTSAGDTSASDTSGAPPPACGDGVLQVDEECDLGPINGPASVCTPACRDARCGDGYVRAGVEACDDANTVDTDACRNDCTAAACGDGVLREGVEECDDANLADDDACPSSCTVARCGDGFTQAGVEECDDANAVDTDACLNTCKAATCGDGIVQAGVEACDGQDLPNAACTSLCALSCVAPFSDCDTDPSNGCEAYIGSAQHCKFCGNSCGDGECVDMKCVFPEPDP